MKNWTRGKTAGAVTAVNKILEDLTGRSGGDHLWESIDFETQSEIKDAWATIIMEAYADPLPPKID